jgi:nicotinamidase-related amidase
LPGTGEAQQAADVNHPTADDETTIASSLWSSEVQEPGDVIVTKRRTSAFAGTDLDMVLRSNSVATSVMVAVTVYDAADRDFRVRVTRDPRPLEVVLVRVRSPATLRLFYCG